MQTIRLLRLQNLKKYCEDPIFYVILGFKILLGTFFTADVSVKGFIPFVSYFVESGFSNPYEHFASISNTATFTGFPYPTMMLWIFSIPRLFFGFLFSGQQAISFLDLFIYHIPILLADVTIYLVLLYWLKGKQKQVLWYYWASPILVYINYFHGQLDVVPMAGLFLSLLFLFRKNYLLSSVFLGVSLAIKTHLFTVVPFYVLFMVVNQFPLKKILGYLCVTLTTFIALIVPYITSPAFLDMVFRASPQSRFFYLGFPYHVGNLEILLAPGAYFLVLFRFFSCRRLSKDMMLLVLGLSFSVLVIFVPPMPGWFYWSMPFLAYFYIKAKGVPIFHLWLLNGLYFLYFFFRPESEIFTSFAIAFPSLSQLATPYQVVTSLGINADTVSNLFFTGMLGAIFMNIMWCYKAGVQHKFQYVANDRPMLMGVSGDSGSGKSTFYRTLEKLFGSQNTLCVDGDDIHKWERDDAHWKQVTHLDPKGNRLYQDVGNIQSLRNGVSIERSHYNHNTGTFTAPEKMKPRPFIIFVGLHTLYVDHVRRMFDLRIFIDTDEVLRIYWKTGRDTSERGYTREKVVTQLQDRQTDSKRYIQPQKDYADLAIHYFTDDLLNDLISESREPHLKLRIRLTNSIHLDPLLDGFDGQSDLKVIHYYDDDMRHQYLEFDGTISSDALQELSQTLIPNILELLHEHEPEWEDNYKGISQLVFLYYFSEMSQLPHHESGAY